MDELPRLLPYLLPVAAVFALLGYWIGGKKSKPATPAPAAAKAPSASSSERQRLRDLEARLRTAESAATAARTEIKTLSSTGVTRADHDALAAELDLARTSITSLEAQLKKSRDVQATLQSRANETGKKNQSRAIAVENDLAAARTEIQRLKTLSDPNTDTIARLQAETETVRTRLRAVEAQLSDRTAELNALQAAARISGARPPRTVASSSHTPGTPLDLLGFEPATAAPAPASPPAASPAPVVLNPPVPLAPDQTVEDPVAVALAAAAATFATGSSILGKPIQPDDLTLIEGIGPGIRDLLRTAGISTWESLAATPEEKLQSLLSDAGPSYAGHHSGSWPQQARLAADAKWFQLKALQEKLDAGRPPESALV